jgi:hypothetical protein
MGEPDKHAKHIVITEQVSMIGPDSSLRAFSLHEVLAGGKHSGIYSGRSQGLGESVSEDRHSARSRYSVGGYSDLSTVYNVWHDRGEKRVRFVR